MAKNNKPIWQWLLDAKDGYWYNINNERFKISEMDKNYIYNVIGFLKKRAWLEPKPAKELIKIFEKEYNSRK